MTPERFRRLRAILERRQPDLTVLADGVHKPHNLAAILRSCDAVGVLEAHAVDRGRGLDVPHLSSAGTGKWLPVRVHGSVGEAVNAIKRDGIQLVAAHFSENAVDYRSLDYTRPTAFLLGTELYGVSAAARAAADAEVLIPMRGHADSLNVSVAAALLLYEAARQREAAGFYSAPRLPAAELERRLFEWAWPRVAGLLRSAGRPYPGLDGDGRFHGNPLLDGGGATAGAGGSGGGTKASP